MILKIRKLELGFRDPLANLLGDESVMKNFLWLNNFLLKKCPDNQSGRARLLLFLARASVRR